VGIGQSGERRKQRGGMGRVRRERDGEVDGGETREGREGRGGEKTIPSPFLSHLKPCVQLRYLRRLRCTTTRDLTAEH